MNRIATGFLLFLSILCISVSVYMLAGMYQEDAKSDQTFEEIRKVFDQEKPEDTKDSENANEVYINPGLLELHEQNPDCVGWIHIEGTKIDYPVMYHPEEKNYYLRRNFHKEYDISGTPYIAEICDLEDFDNLILYGHHMNSGAMFAHLDKYKFMERKLMKLWHVLPYRSIREMTLPITYLPKRKRISNTKHL